MKRRFLVEMETNLNTDKVSADDIAWAVQGLVLTTYEGRPDIQVKVQAQEEYVASPEGESGE